MKKILLVVLIAAIGHVAFIYKFRQQTIVPYPYVIAQKSWDRENVASSANVLLLGDRMGKRLERYIPNLILNTSKNLERPLSIVNWAEDHEGIHRTVAKLKSLKKAPQLIFYHGMSEEFFEKRFLTTDQKTIEENFELYNNDKILSMIMTFPIISKFVYKAPNYYHLGKNIRKDTTKYPDRFKQVQLEMGYKFFQFELDDLIRYARENGSILVLMTTPLNLEVNTGKVCKNSISSTLIREQEEIELLINDGDAKSAYIKTKGLLKNTSGNARTYRLMGKTLIKLGRFSEARAYLENSTAFDCKTWRSNVVFNNIVRKAAEKHDLRIIDFDDMVNKNIGSNVLFMDKLYPQELFYERLIQVVEKTIYSSLKI